MTPQSIELESFVAGDTWNGLPSVTIQVNGTAPASPLASARMRFAKVGVPGSVAVELASGDPGAILIMDAAGWELAVPPQIVPGLSAGKWIWNLETTAQDGTIKTYLEGTLTVLRDV